MSAITRCPLYSMSSIDRFGCIFVENGKSEHHRILQIWISLGTKFQLKMTVFIIWTKFAQKRYFHSEKKREHHHWILHTGSIRETRFHLKLTIFNFWTKLVQSICCVYIWYIPNHASFISFRKSRTRILAENQITLKILPFYRKYTIVQPKIQKSVKPLN